MKYSRTFLFQTGIKNEKLSTNVRDDLLLPMRHMALLTMWWLLDTSGTECKVYKKFLKKTQAYSRAWSTSIKKISGGNSIAFGRYENDNGLLAMYYLSFPKPCRCRWIHLHVHPTSGSLFFWEILNTHTWFGQRMSLASISWPHGSTEKFKMKLNDYGK